MTATILTGEQLAARTDLLSQKLAAFLPFRRCVLYFADRPLAEAELLASERCVIAPVLWEGEQLAQLRLEQVNVKSTRKVLPFLPQIISLCLENIILEMRRHQDERTGMITESAFLTQMAERMRPGQDRPLHERCFGLVVISWQNGELVRQRAGGHTVSSAFERMAAVLRSMLCGDSVATTLGVGEWRHEFAIIFQGQGRGFCHGFGRKALAALADMEILDPFSGGRIPLAFSVGHAVFPQDMSGADLHGDAFSQALKLKDKARLAAMAASQSGNGVLAYGWLLSRGGIIQEVLSGNRVKVTLGRNCQARVGMRFQIMHSARTGESKGQIVLRQVTATEAMGEVLFLTNPDILPLPGDGVALIHENAAGAVANLLSQEAFAAHFSAEARNLRQFVLSITRFAGDDASTGALSAFLDSYCASTDYEGDKCLTRGLFGRDGQITLWPDISAEEVAQRLKSLHEAASRAGLKAASGVVPYPFLDIGKEEMEGACLKALEYAQLLPMPHIGIIDAVALTISGDKCFSQGDELGAVDEYRRALLLKPHDALIMNSLGVCLAALNRLEAAAHMFASALECCADAPLRGKIYYNLANIQQKDNNLREARHFYRQCLRADPLHVYAWLRLGQIAELAGKIRSARALYARVRKMAGKDQKLAALVQRRLARLETGASQKAKARELLHDTLLRDPNDAAAMLLLAESYLDEDTVMAELLARKSLRLGGNGYDVLARALEAQGRLEESRLVRERG